MGVGKHTMLKVVLSGIFYPMAILRYFEAAFERRSDVELWTVGPYTGRQIPWDGGMVLAERYARSPDCPVGRSIVPTCPFRWAEHYLPWEPDLWVEIDAGFHFTGRPKSGKVAIIGTDPHVLNYSTQRGLADKFFCMQKHYQKPTDIYLPYAADPLWHRRIEVKGSAWDAVLLGIHYQQRDQLVKALEKEGLKVYYGLGPVFDQAHRIYLRTKVGLNWSSLKDLNARVFEILHMGLPLVTNRVPDMGDFFTEGIDYFGFDTIEEAVKQVLKLLENGTLAKRLGDSGAYHAAQNTWDHRVDQILEEMVSA